MDKGSKDKKAPEGDDDLPPPPPPLEVHVKVRLHHWKTAMDSLKEDREGTEMKWFRLADVYSDYDPAQKREAAQVNRCGYQKQILNKLKNELHP